MPVTSDDILNKLKDRTYRLDNLYTIIPEAQIDGKTVIPFKLRDAQRELLDNWHNRVIINKCRKIGYSSLLALICLDACLFNQNYKCSVVDFKETGAMDKLQMISDAWYNSEKYVTDPVIKQIWITIKNKVKLTHESRHELRFSNGSVFTASTSTMGSSPNLLWISELGPLASQSPDRAAKLKRGSLNSVAPDSTLIIESTAEGATGIFYDLLQLALETAGKTELEKTEYKLIFKPWFHHPSYTIPVVYETNLDQSTRDYFEELNKNHGIEVTLNQKMWWQIKRREIGDDMFSQYPSIFEESIRSTTVGVIYPQIQTLKSQGRIKKLTYENQYPLYTAWDLGVSDATCGVLFQVCGRDILMLRSFSTNGSPASRVAEVIREWEKEFRAPIAQNFMPHDASRRDQSYAKVYVQYLYDAGLPTRSVYILPRCNSIWNGIGVFRSMLTKTWFDIKCNDRFTGNDGESLPSLIQSIENYKRNGKSGEPLHDIYSNFADACRYIAEATELGLVRDAVSTNNRLYNRANVQKTDKDIYKL